MNIVVALLGAGCTGPDGVPTARGTADTAIPEPVVVRVYHEGNAPPFGAGGTPHAGGDIYVADEAGDFVRHVTTDKEGQVSVRVPVGGSVTLDRPDDHGLELHTVFDVQPGDRLMFGSPGVPNSDVELQVEVAQPGRTAGRFHLLADCGGRLLSNDGLPGPIELRLPESCTGVEEVRLLMVFFDTDGVAEAYAATTVRPEESTLAVLSMYDGELFDVGAVVDVRLAPLAVDGEVHIGFGVHDIAVYLDLSVPNGAWAAPVPPALVDRITVVATVAMLGPDGRWTTSRAQRIPTSLTHDTTAWFDNDAFLPLIASTGTLRGASPGVSTPGLLEARCSGAPMQALFGRLHQRRQLEEGSKRDEWRFVGPAAETLAFPRLGEVVASLRTGTVDELNTFVQFIASDEDPMPAWRARPDVTESRRWFGRNVPGELQCLGTGSR